MGAERPVELEIWPRLTYARESSAVREAASSVQVSLCGCLLKYLTSN
jgi:hypothetical protein